MFNALKRIYLVLGDGCNFSCRYCIQSGQSFVREQVRSEVMDFIKNAAYSRGEHADRLIVMFWGGEPLVYFDEIKKVVNYCGDTIDYCMVSNGALLSEEIVEFINANNISFVLSSDGPNTTHTRNNNILENAILLQLFNAINIKSFDCVISAYSQDIFEVWHYFESKSPSTFVNYEFLKCSWDMPEDLYSYDIDRFCTTMELACAAAHEGILAGNLVKEYWLLDPGIKQVMAMCDQNNAVKNTIPRCNQTRRNLNIDALGNILSCHNFGEKIGSIEDDYFELIAKYDDLISGKRGTLCTSCNYVELCRGGCPYTHKDCAGQKKCCEIKKIYFECCLKFVAMFESLYEEVILDD